MQQNFRWQDVIIHYRIEGSGNALVLLHGFAEDGHIWDNQINYLKQFCKIIVPDLPGSGQSGFLHKENTEVTIEDYADCIHALLMHEKVSGCILLGHSMGGYITLSFAEKYPQMLQAFGLVHSTAFADSAEKKQNRLKGIKLMEDYGVYSFIKNTAPNLFAAKFKQAHPEKVEAFIELSKPFRVEALQQYYRAMVNRKDRTLVLAESKLPVLFILGEEDLAVPLSDLLQQVHLPKIAYIHILKNVGHMGMWESANEVNDCVYQFFSSLNDNLL